MTLTPPQIGTLDLLLQVERTLAEADKLRAIRDRLIITARNHEVQTSRTDGAAGDGRRVSTETVR